MPRLFARLTLLALAIVLAAMATAYLISFAVHAWNMLAFPYPLDYGEGPLLAQVERLLAGTPVWHLYADPGNPPYLVVNYPPLYPLLTAALGLVVPPLLAGRLVSLLATLGCVAAIVVLARAENREPRTENREPRTGNREPRAESREPRPETRDLRPETRDLRPETREPRAESRDPRAETRDLRAETRDLRPETGWLERSAVLGSLFFASLFLTIPVVREWGVLMRVDMLGVCLGLWGLVQLRVARDALRVRPEDAPRATRHAPRATRHASRAGLLFLLALFVKPSLIAAPAAGLLWLGTQALFGPREARRAGLRAVAVVVGVMALGGGLLLALLEWTSGGWFLYHVVTANANRWEYALAEGFWKQQIRLRWPLALAALLGLVFAIVRNTQYAIRNTQYVLPLLYILFGIVTAAGVGKVGAYANYFLELYAGLVWLITLVLCQESGVRSQESGVRSQIPVTRLSSLVSRLSSLVSRLSSFVLALLIIALLYYAPLWDKTRLRPAGLVEPSPPRLAFGRYGLWQDLQREHDLLAAQARVYRALLAEVRAAGPALFTDMPGVAAGAGAISRMQVFEARQLYDQGRWDQRALLLDLANGEPPLAVIDYLGNWMPPELVEVVRRRYAHDGSRGTFDLYRPVAPGPRRPADLMFADLRLSGFHLAPPAGAAPGAAYEPGALLIVTLEWEERAAEPPAACRLPPAACRLDVVLQLTTEDGTPLLEDERPLFYGAFTPADLPAGRAAQHMQPLALPGELLPGSYGIAVGLRAPGAATPALQPLARLTVEARGGVFVEETGYFVPAPFQRAWEELGGIERGGHPLTPAVPFAWGTLQCFERICLELREGAVTQRPLGELLYLAETIRGAGCPDSAPVAPDVQAICPALTPLAESFGTASIGPPISGLLRRNGFDVQWTRYARLERWPASGAPGLGRLGDDALRLPPGTPYRWP